VTYTSRTFRERQQFSFKGLTSSGVRHRNSPPCARTCIDSFICRKIAVCNLRLVCYGCKTPEARLCSNKILFSNTLINMSFPLVTSQLWPIMCIYTWDSVMPFFLESLGLCSFRTVDKMNFILFRIFKKVQAASSRESWCIRHWRICTPYVFSIHLIPSSVKWFEFWI
jgi:hypothetical protein